MPEDLFDGQVMFKPVISVDKVFLKNGLVFVGAGSSGLWRFILDFLAVLHAGPLLILGYLCCLARAGDLLCADCNSGVSILVQATLKTEETRAWFDRSLATRGNQMAYKGILVHEQYASTQGMYITVVPHQVGVVRGKVGVRGQMVSTTLDGDSDRIT